MNELKIKLLTPTAKVPVRAHEYDAGLDLHCLDDAVLKAGGSPIKIRTGIAVEVQPGYQATVLPKSGLSSRGVHIYPGTVDAGYTSEVMVVAQNLRCVGHADDWWQGQRHVGEDIVFKAGDKIAQLVITRVELPTVRVVDELEQHGTRGANGWGSTGNR